MIRGSEEGGGVLTVQKVMDDAPMGVRQAGIVALVVLALILEGADIQLAAFAAPAIRKEWALDAAALGPALAAVMVGMIGGGVIGGFLGDRWGRKPLLIAAITIFGFATMAIALAGNLWQLVALRFVAGLGFGAAYPNATVLVAEWTPLKFRPKAVSMLTMGLPVGGLIGAAVSSYTIPHLGWRATFGGAGLISLLLVALMVAGLPESLIFLSRRPEKHPAIRRTLGALSQGAVAQDAIVIDASQDSGGQARKGESIFAPANRRVTAGLWIAFFGNLTVAYLVINWLPMLLTMLDVEQAAAIRGAFYANMAGIAGLVAVAWIYARMGSKAGLNLMILIAAGAIVLTGLLTQAGNMGLSGKAMVVLAGACVAYWGVAGVQAGLWSLCVHAYSAESRATGLGWGNSVGRLGAVTSTLVGGALLGMQPSPLIFLIFMAGALLFALAGVMTVDRHAPPVAKG
ncbi:MAG: MFS transporter [Sphingobium sp.]